MLRAGECCRLGLELGKIKLCRFRSRIVLTLDRLISDTGDSARPPPFLAAYDGTPASLSAPPSHSKCIDARLLSGIMPDILIWDRGVLAPRGLLDRVEAAVEDGGRSLVNAIDLLFALRRASDIADGVSREQGNMVSSAGRGSRDCTISSSSTSSTSSKWSSLESVRSPAAIFAALATAASIHSWTRISNSIRIRSEYSRIPR